MPRFPAMLVCVALILSIAACGNDDGTDDTPPEDPVDPTPTEVVNDPDPTPSVTDDSDPDPTPESTAGDEGPDPTPEPEATPEEEDEPVEPADPEVTMFVPDVRMPGSLNFTPDGRLFFNQTWDGLIRVVEDGQLLDESFAEINIVQAEGFTEHGLLGLAFHPDFEENRYVYVFYTVPNEQGGPSHQRIVRFADEGNVGTNEEIIVDDLPAGPGCCHNGGRILFGPDGLLYVTLGDTENADLSQDPNNVAGSILRYNDDGSIPEDNPFGADNPIYAYGLRNPYGLTFHPQTQELWVTENGPNGFDEVNRIEPGENYGWPIARGMAGDPNYVDPVWATDEGESIGPTGIQIPTGEAIPDLTGRVVFCDWNTATARVLEISEDYEVLSEDALPLNCNLDVTEGPDGALYLATAEEILRYGPPME